MKYPDNIFGQLLRKELEASDKISEHYKNRSGGKTSLAEKILGSDVVAVHKSEFESGGEDDTND